MRFPFSVSESLRLLLRFDSAATVRLVRQGSDFVAGGGPVKSSIVREMRSVPRYSVNLPVCVTWRPPGDAQPPLNAITRDISTRGMYVVADAAPAHGDLLEFEIDMALDEATPLVLVRGEGRVVRAERDAEQPSGFAVENVWFRLCEPEQGQALPIDFSALASAVSRSPVGTGRTARNRGLTLVRPPAKDSSDPNSDRGVSK
jgi:hypothetical protein